MIRTTLIAGTVAVISTLVSFDAEAKWRFNECRKTPFTDVRGDTFDGALDGTLDGKTTIAELVAFLADEDRGADREFTTLLFAVANSPIVLGAASDPNARLTVFAPTDEAFAAINPSVLAGIIEGENAEANGLEEGELGSLTQTLLYHTLGFRFDPRRVVFQRSIRTLQGDSVYIKRGRKNSFVNNSAIDCGGVRTDNGNVWIIDSVLQNQY